MGRPERAPAHATKDPVVVVRQPECQALWLELRSPLVVGRDCEGLLIADPEVSRRHLELNSADGGVWCTDLGSTNGTFLDGERISEPAVLTPGAFVTLGATTIALDAREGGAVSGRRTILHSLLAGAPQGSADPRRTSIDLVADEVLAAGWRSPSEGETVTILFSDIEESTERAGQMGDVAWVQLLDVHNRLFHDELAASGGHAVKSLGDGFMLTFRSVRKAIGFAVRVQHRMGSETRDQPGGPIRVRMGLHTGEAISDTSGDLYGRHVNKAARIADSAAGGQILVSETVREIAHGGDLDFADGVGVALKGLPGTHVVHEVSLEVPDPGPGEDQ